MTKRRKTRGQGEGSIYRRKDGLWVAALNLGWKGGKRDRKYLYGKTREEAAGKLADAIADQRRGIPVPTGRQTVGQFLDRWLEEVVKPSRRPSTHRSYAQYVRLHVAPSIGRKPLAKLTPQDVHALLNDRLSNGLSPRSVAYVLTILRLALGQAVKWDLVRRNVAALVDRPRAPRYEATPLTLAQAKRLLEAAKGTRWDALVRVALALGLRKGEALGLRWQDVDLDGGTLAVRHTLQRVKGVGLVLVEPKTEQSRRTLPLPASCAAALREHRGRQTEERLVAGSRWREHGFVFPTGIGTPLDGRDLSRSFHRILDGAGLPRVRFHDLRHSCGTLLMAQGVPQRVVMAILGHTNAQMTLRYQHAIPDVVRDAADRMDALFAGTAGDRPRPRAPGRRPRRAGRSRHPGARRARTGADKASS